MLLYLLGFLGGILTIISPCILPVLPFVFSRADQPFRRSGLPLLLGMAVTFAAVASVAKGNEDWPRFRGVNGSGVSTSRGLPV